MQVGPPVFTLNCWPAHTQSISVLQTHCSKPPQRWLPQHKNFKKSFPLQKSKLSSPVPRPQHQEAREQSLSPPITNCLQNLSTTAASLHLNKQRNRRKSAADKTDKYMTNSKIMMSHSGSDEYKPAWKHTAEEQRCQHYGKCSRTQQCFN